MKYQITLIVFLFIGTAGYAQTKHQKNYDSAVKYYILANQFERDNWKSNLDNYDKYRKVCLGACHFKSDSLKFMTSMVDSLNVYKKKNGVK